MTSARAAETLSALRSMHPFAENPPAPYCLLQKLFRSGCAMTVLPCVNRTCHSGPALNPRRRCHRSLAEGDNIPAARAVRTRLDNAPSLVDCAHSADDVAEANRSIRREANRQRSFLLA